MLPQENYISLDQFWCISRAQILMSMSSVLYSSLKSREADPPWFLHQCMGRRGRGAHGAQVFNNLTQYSTLAFSPLHLSVKCLPTKQTQKELQKKAHGFNYFLVFVHIKQQLTNAYMIRHLCKFFIADNAILFLSQSLRNVLIIITRQVDHNSQVLVILCTHVISRNQAQNIRPCVQNTQAQMDKGSLPAGVNKSVQKF